MLYFAYGSNLHPARLGARLGRAPGLVATGLVRGRRLAFQKIGRDGSAKCDAPGGAGTLHGALYELGAGDRARLDRFEGLGAGYEREKLVVATRAGEVEAFAYLAQPDHVDEALLPFGWYRRLVLAGARHHRFPASYLRAIAAVSVVEDPDRGQRSDGAPRPRGAPGGNRFPVAREPPPVPVDPAGTEHGAWDPCCDGPSAPQAVEGIPGPAPGPSAARIERVQEFP